MENNKLKINSILEALEKSVESGVDFEWTDGKAPATEDSFKKVSDTGKHEMPDGKFTGVKEKAPVKIDTDPTFDKAKDEGVKGGAQQPEPNKTPKKMTQKKMTKESATAALELIKLIESATGKKVRLIENFGRKQITRQELQAAFKQVMANRSEYEKEYQETAQEFTNTMDTTTANEHAAANVLSHALFYDILGYEADEPNAHNFEEAPGVFVMECANENDYKPFTDKIIATFGNQIQETSRSMRIAKGNSAAPKA